MNKWIILIVSSLIVINAYAKESWCGYKDYFRIKNETHPGLHIINNYSDQNVLLELVSDRSFIISDSTQCSAGYIHLTVAYDNTKWCILNIKDGPLMNHPDVKASFCNGMHYINTLYDGYGSHSYTINLD